MQLELLDRPVRLVKSVYRERKVSVDHRVHRETQGSAVIPDCLDSPGNEVTVVIQAILVRQAPLDAQGAPDLLVLLVHQALRVLEAVLDNLASRVREVLMVSKVL